MAIRNVEYFWPKGRRHRFACNRGANGIDGTLSTAIGLAHGAEPTWLLTGDLALLQHYLRRQQPDQNRTIEFSDRLPGLFMHSDPLLGLARDLALSGLDILPPLKREFVRHAAGVAGMTGWATDAKGQANG